MKTCRHCGAKLHQGATVCLKCGYLQQEESPAVLTDPVEAEFPVIRVSELRPDTENTEGKIMNSGGPVGGAVPAARLKTNRGLLRFLLLSLITFGIYAIVAMEDVSMDINIIAGRYDGKRTMSYCLVMFLFSWLTLGIVPLVWAHRMCKRIGCELSRRGIAYGFGAGTFWGWGFFGSLILVGPFIYTHKLLKSMNLLAAHYNTNG